MRFSIGCLFFLNSFFAMGASAPVCMKETGLGQPPACLGIGGKSEVPNTISDFKKNVLGKTLQACGKDPVTGFYRSGSCETGADDSGLHTVCAQLTKEFLEFSLSKGNDLISPKPQFGFPGLKPGQRWCLCAARWLESAQAGKAPPVDLEATHEKTLQIIPLEQLTKHKL